MCMYSFLIGVALLFIGFLTYGKFVEHVIRPDDRKTPAYTNNDGVDYVPIPLGRAYLIQMLNVIGLGPIFGGISGALWGPVVYLWIVFGTIFAGAVHDYLAGMLSERNNGASISEIVGKYLGPTMANVMRVFSVILLVMVGVVFMVGPAQLLALLTPENLNVKFWTLLILFYYFMATLLPVDKIIGKVYPLFGIALIVMALSIGCATIMHANERPMLELWSNFNNMYPNKQLPIWPLMCITVACGAISGFHATQSPIVARCIVDERQGRKIFYAAMLTEGLIALIWASAAIAFFYNKDGGQGLMPLLEMKGGNSNTVYLMATTLLGGAGSFLALLGVIACPITSGDTAFRSARLTISDWFKIDMSNIKKRLAVSAVVLLAGYFVSLLDYSSVWRYFSWSNQTLAMIVLWTGAVYIVKYREKKYCWIACIPATYMTMVAVAYILQAPEGFRLNQTLSNAVGIIVALTIFILFIVLAYKKQGDKPLVDVPLEVKKRS